MKFPVMRYICDTQDSGYGNAARGYIQAMRTLGIEGDTLRVVPVMAPTSMAPIGGEEEHGPFTTRSISEHQPGAGTTHGSVFETGDVFESYVSGNWSGDDKINIVHLNPGMLQMYHTPLGGRYNIAITAWETDRLTAREYKLNGNTRTMVMDVNEYDEVWVPTSAVKKVFEESGVTKPIFVIPHVLREEVLDMQPKEPRIAGRQPIGFYTIGPWNARKNHLDLVRAYYATGWNIQTLVRLQICTLPVVRDSNSVEAHEWIANDAIRQLREASSLNKLDLPPLTLLGAPRRFIPHIKQSHGANHVYITASRGEAFGLPTLDAVALGNYVVGGFPALEDLAAVAPSAVTVLESRKVPITPMPEVSGYELDHEWWEVPIANLTAEFLALKDFIRTEGMPLHDEVNAVRDAYCPGAVGKIIANRLEHAANVAESSGW